MTLATDLPDRIVDFWTEIGPKGWYATEAALDTRIRDSFGAAWEQAHNGAFLEWGATARGALAYLILTDQFPRNMFRGDGRSFATDARALAASFRFTHASLDLTVAGPIRQFFYLPFMHAETRSAQDHGVCLFLMRMPGTDNLEHARAHRLVIRRFGRFPYRNAALGRHTSPLEQAFLDQGGYGAALAELRSGAAPA